MIDLRSDTVTVPSAAMRAAIAEAPVGDDFYGEDPSVARLEQVSAKLLGKEAGLFVPSGTMGNLLAYMAHCPGGAEVVGPALAHSFMNEGGGPSRIAGMTVRPVAQAGGNLDVAAYASNTRPAGRLSQGTRLYLVEQPTRGFVVPLALLRELHDEAATAGVLIHMDGARIFNAAIALGVPAAEIAAPADSVMFCISKGLGAPVGSLLVGSAAFIERARYLRQMLGGGMRQAGVVAAAGLFALEHNVARLADDHANARRLAAGLSRLPGLRLDRDVVETNIFFVELGDLMTSAEFVGQLRERGVSVNVPALGRQVVRFVTHLGVEDAQIEAAVDAVGAVAGTVYGARTAAAAAHGS